MPPLTLHGGCHCGAVTYTVATNTEERLHGNYCHCTDCRKTLGFFFGLFVNVKVTQFEIHANPKTALVAYASSDRAMRQHCGVCGASITWHENGDETIDVHAATLELPDEIKGSGKGLLSLFDQTMHLWLQDNWKSGTGVLLLGDGLKKYLNSTRGPMWEPTEKDKLLPVENEVDDDETIEASCHCGGVKFSIQRPPKDYAEDPVLANWIKTQVLLLHTPLFPIKHYLQRPQDLCQPLFLRHLSQGVRSALLDLGFRPAKASHVHLRHD